MMLVCGHVITRDSLTKLCKNGGYVVALNHYLLVNHKPDMLDVASVRIARRSPTSVKHYGCTSRFVNNRTGNFVQLNTLAFVYLVTRICMSDVLYDTYVH